MVLSEESIRATKLSLQYYGDYNIQSLVHIYLSQTCLNHKKALYKKFWWVLRANKAVPATPAALVISQHDDSITLVHVTIIKSLKTF